MKSLYRLFEVNTINHYLLTNSDYTERVDQLTGGPFYAKIEALHHPEVSIFRRFVNQTIREVGLLPEHTSALNFHPSEHAYYLKGTYYGLGGISSILGGKHFETITQKNTTHYTIIINEQQLHKYLAPDQIHQYQDFVQVKRDITSCEKLRYEIPAIIDRLFETLVSVDNNEVADNHYTATVQEIFDNLLRLINAATFNRMRVNSNAYLLDKVVDAINDLELPQISIFNLANKLHTNRRNIETAFRHYIQISPKEYINNLRLNNIRVSLLEATKNTARVSTTARDYGIQHLSNFSKAYYRLFNEQPHETLARNPLESTQH